ncbi:MAG: hypothetical protein A3H02_01130 [Candidatus Niyogibacteria bacterium RIFCSPLOWO2_12_FULL_41_13]|uniref:Uncharacterized protein n=1 Tax=Candidatus Niyogibacteria bacterium RIFCSPLOWO2_12_FULL_41_13 TaxID=1801726 RepID=A0A1G2F506_9BACT|nr:MAG: hypothetical protein A3H02_01130 [Candidatus Niyogibacteria bacterium RIFCSPLOWO2_12_FULL_41_13]
MDIITGTLRAILSGIIPILMGLATIVFLWGAINYVFAADDEEKRKTFKTYIVWGIIGLFSMVAVWGIVRVLISTFGLGGLPWWASGGGTIVYPADSPRGEFFRIIEKAHSFIISPLIGLMFILGTVVFLWGMVEFVFASGSGDEDKIKSGKKHIVWGIIALFAMVGMFAIVEALRATFGFSGLPYLLPIK